MSATPLHAILADRALIRITGDEARAWLQNLITADIDALGPDECTGAALLTPQGKILFDFLVATPSPGEALLEARADIAPALAQRLTFYKLRARLAVGAPEPVFMRVSDGGPGLRDIRFSTPLFRLPSISETGWDHSDYDRLRIRQGVAESGADYAVGDAFPHDVNLDQTNGVGFRKGCYVGQEVVSRMQHRGTARKRMVIAAGDRDLPPPLTPITADGREIGQLGTVYGAEALAMVRLDKATDATAAGIALMAGDAALALRLPDGARFVLEPESGGDA